MLQIRRVFSLVLVLKIRPLSTTLTQCKRKSPSLESNSVQESVKNGGGFGGKLYIKTWSPVSQTTLQQGEKGDELKEILLSPRLWNPPVASSTSCNNESQSATPVFFFLSSPVSLGSTRTFICMPVCREFLGCILCFSNWFTFNLP